MSVRRGNPVAVAGLALYVGSFVLTAVAETTMSYRGFECAYISLLVPWLSAPPEMFRLGEWFRPVLAVAGFINPVFLAALAVGAARELRPRRWIVLRLLVCAMIPFCWLVFWSAHLRPRGGHVAWVVGMLVVLFGRELSQREAR